MPYIEAETVDEVTREKLNSLLEQSRHRYWKAKRSFDIVACILILLLIWPLLLIVPIIIMIDDHSAGPIYKQVRVGRHGEEFLMYKFRTMHAGADQMKASLEAQNEMDGPVFKIKEDPRITRVGRFIRKTSIDELPQLWNILKGDMSIVGPRPALPREVAQYDDYERQRLYVTPGLTCYWQIQPHRNELTFDEWMELDLKYIEERSFVTDWKIIFGTFGAVLGMNGT